MVLPTTASTSARNASKLPAATTPATPDQLRYEAGKGNVLSHFADIVTPAAAADNNNNHRLANDVPRGSRLRARRSLDALNDEHPRPFSSATVDDDNDVRMDSNSSRTTGASSGDNSRSYTNDHDMADALFGTSNNNQSDHNTGPIDSRQHKLEQWRRDRERGTHAPAAALRNAQPQPPQQQQQVLKRPKGTHRTDAPLDASNQSTESDPPAASLMFAMDFSPPRQQKHRMQPAAAAAIAVRVADAHTDKIETLSCNPLSVAMDAFVLTLVFVASSYVLAYLRASCFQNHIPPPKPCASIASLSSSTPAATAAASSASFVSSSEPFSPAVSLEFLTRDLDEEEQALRAKSDKDRAYLYKKRYIDTYGFAVVLARRVMKLEKRRTHQNADVDALRAKVRSQEQLLATGSGSATASQVKQIQSLCREVSALVQQLGERDAIIQSLHDARDVNTTTALPAERPSDTRVAELEGVIDALHDQIAAMRTSLEELGDSKRLLEDELAAVHDRAERSQQLYEAAETQRTALATGFEQAQAQLQQLHAQWTHEKAALLAAATTDEQSAAAVAVQRDQLQAANAALQHELQHERSSGRTLTAQLADERTAAADAQALAARLTRELADAHMRIAALRQSESRLVGVEAELTTTQQQLAAASTRVETLEHDVEMHQHALQSAETQFHDKSVMMEKRLFQAEIVRRSLHNKVMELKGNIRVFCRVRPILSHEARAAAKSDELYAFPDYAGERRQIELAANTKAHVSYAQQHGNRDAATKKYTFDFDLVFDSACSQEDVFLEVSALVQSALDGYNVCIFAYGQTGSGKTFTMQGREDSPGYATMAPSSHMGIVGRAIAHIYATIADLRSSGWSFSVTLEMIEIYNETLRDLLAPSGSTDKVELRLDADGRPAIANSCVHAVANELDAWQLLCKAMSRRSTKATNMNDRSSRSHCVITFRMSGENAHTGDRRVGVVHLVDLAGSERLNKSGSGSDRELLKEAQAINKSLSSLGNVICALAKKSAHVPFRDSKLTHFLSPSLGGDSKTLMICTLSPLAQHRDESLNSLRFAKTVNSCEIAYASVSHRS